MAILSLTRSEQTNPQIVFMKTDDSLSTMTTNGYLTDESDNIQSLRFGWTWEDDDVILCIYSGDEFGWFSRDASNNKLVVDTLDQDSVSTSAIQDDAVTNAKIAANAVQNEQMADDAVDTDELADDAVNAAKMADSILDGVKVATGASGDSDAMIPVLYVVTTAGGGTETKSLTINQKITVVDFWCVLQGAGDTSDTLQLTDGDDNAISDALDISGADTDLVRAGQINDANRVEDTALKVVETDAAGSDSPVVQAYIFGFVTA